MKNKLKKWPRNWVEHVTQTCLFYFSDKDILFVAAKILHEYQTENSPIIGIKLSFDNFGKVYDIFINHEESMFVIDYYYKNYYRIRKKRKAEQNFLFMMDDTWSKGSDNIGLFSYSDLGSQSSRDYIISAYNISQSIENIINYHFGNDGGDDEGGENNPIKPFSPSDVIEPELSYY